ncbi:hypothetical protein [Flavilitoribacter nigricans]|uniref:hypothetical protein n=1 Tax=Flavilitoribacter nigricans TaxID=70997 RepID=UPI001C9E63E9|nr:hypothetical protein [Flavilitoribacter nigricans]
MAILFLVSALTIGGKGIRAASVNPATTLRDGRWTGRGPAVDYRPFRRRNELCMDERVRHH